MRTNVNSAKSPTLFRRRLSSRFRRQSLYANRATLGYTGLAMEDVVKSGFRERIFHPDDVQRLKEYRQSALAKGVPFRIEQRALGRDGQYRWFFIQYNPFRDEQGRIVRWYATGTDVDEREKKE